MKKWIRFLAVVSAIVAALVVAIVVLANVLITPERIKAALLPLAEDTLHRRLEIGEIDISLLSGIEIHGLTLYEQDGKESFVSTDLVRLRYQLLPLLMMKVVVDEVRLEKPKIRIVRFVDRRFNFSDLLALANDTASAQKNSKPASPAESAGGTPIDLLVSNVVLQDGQLIYLDHLLGNKPPYRYELSDLQFAAKGVSLAGKVPLSLQCQLNGSQLLLDGQLSLQPLRGDFSLELKSLDAIAFRPYLQDLLPGTLRQLKIDLKASGSATAEEVALKGDLAFVDLDLLLDALPDAPLVNARLDAHYDLLFVAGQELLKLTQLDLDYNGIKANLKGEVSGLMSQPALALNLELPRLQLRQAISAVPLSLVGDLKALDPAGEVTGKGEIKGLLAEPARLLKSAVIDLTDVQATAAGQRPALSGRLLFSGDQLLSENLQLRLADNRAVIDFKATRLFTPPININADITSQRFLLEPLLQGSAAPAAATAQSSSTGKAGSPSPEPGPFNIPLRLTGKLAVAETSWKGLQISNFQAQYELKDNILNITRMDGQVSGGTFSNSARIDLGKQGLSYSANIGLQRIQADPLLAAFAPKAAGSLLGAMDLNLTLDGKGTTWQTLSRNLSGVGTTLINEGRLLSPGLVQGFTSFLQLPELNDIRFNNFSAQFKVIDGRIQLDSQMVSDKLKLYPKGSIGLDGSLNLALDTRLSPALSAKLDRKSAVIGYLADQEGWARLPLLLKGDFTTPRFTLDPKGVQEQASKVIGEQLGRQLDKLFKRSDPGQGSTTGQAAEEKAAPTEDPARKLLQDSLQKLFGN